MDKYYYSFNDYLHERFRTRVHRFGLNAHFSCPNKDGTLGKDGCIFCNDRAFSRFADTALTLEKQIDVSMEFCRKRYKAAKFIAYFQNATNTNADVATLRRAFDTIKLFPDVVGLFISTRPDCIDEEKLDLIESYSKDYEVWIEYGLQSVHDATLRRINRLHTFSQSLEAIETTSKRRIKVGVHVILGLPGESGEDMMETARTIAALPVSGVKLHVLHVLKNTKLERLFEKKEVKLLKAGEYISLVCDFLERLNPKCVILRLVSDAKQGVLVAPDWINKKERIAEDIKEEFKRRGTYQGSLYGKEKSMRIR